jgi:hypothetical protein
VYQRGSGIADVRLCGAYKSGGLGSILARAKPTAFRSSSNWEVGSTRLTPCDGNMIVRRRLSDENESRGAFDVFAIFRVPSDGSHASKDRQRSVIARQAARARSTGGVSRPAGLQLVRLYHRSQTVFPHPLRSPRRAMIGDGSSLTREYLPRVDRRGRPMSENDLTIPMSGDDLTVRATLLALAVAFGLGGVTVAQWKSRWLIFGLFSAMGLMLAFSVFWGPIAAHWPATRDFMRGVAVNDYAFGLVAIVIASAFAIDLSLRSGWLGSATPPVAATLRASPSDEYAYCLQLERIDQEDRRQGTPDHITGRQMRFLVRLRNPISKAIRYEVTSLEINGISQPKPISSGGVLPPLSNTTYFTHWIELPPADVEKTYNAILSVNIDYGPIDKPPARKSYKENAIGAITE